MLANESIHAPHSTTAETRQWAMPAVVITLLAVFIGFQPMPSDPDLWFHLAGGELMIAEGAVPTADPFSFTRQGQPWTPHSWLFDVTTFGLWESIGPRAAEAVMAIVFAATILLSFSILARALVHPLAALGICAAIAIAAANSRGLRPQVWSLLFSNGVIGLCVAHQWRLSRRIAIAAPVILLIWAQVHAGCVMGVAILGLWLVGRCIDIFWARNPSAPNDTGGQATSGAPRCELTWLFATMLACAAAILITPHAITHYQYVLLTMNLACLKLTTEWQSPQLLPLATPDIFLYLLGAAIAVILFRTKRRPRWSSTILFGAITVLAFSGVRHIPLMCIAAIPLLADILGQHKGWRRSAVGGPVVASEIKSHLLPNPVFELFRAPRFRTGIAIGIILCLAAAWRFPSSAEQRYSAAEPVVGSRALTTIGGEWNVFTTYNTGGYVLWSSPGKLRVMIDSRADVYGDELVYESTRARTGEKWQQLFDRWNITAAVIERGDALADILKSDPHWRTLAIDASAITFIRSLSPGAMAAINKVESNGTGS